MVVPVSKKVDQSDQRATLLKLSNNVTFGML